METKERPVYLAPACLVTKVVWVPLDPKVNLVYLVWKEDLVHDVYLGCREKKEPEDEMAYLAVRARRVTKDYPDQMVYLADQETRETQDLMDDQASLVKRVNQVYLVNLALLERKEDRACLELMDHVDGLEETVSLVERENQDCLAYPDLMDQRERWALWDSQDRMVSQVNQDYLASRV